MKKLTTIFCLVVIATILLPATVALAYLYKAPVSVTENASTSHDMLPVLWNQNNSWLSSNGFMNSTANDTRVQTLAGSNKPWMVADNKTLTAIPVEANSQTNLYFVTGENEASAMDIIFGQGGYVTTADSSTIEIGDNGSVSTSVYLPSDSSANITRKDAALFVTWDGSGSVTAYTNVASLSFLPTGVGASTAIANVNGAATHWGAVSDSSDASYVWTTSAVAQLDLYEVADIPADYYITSVTIWMRSRVTGGGGQNFKSPVTRIDGVNYTGSEQVSGAAWEDEFQTYATSPATGLRWTVTEFNNAQFGVSMRQAGTVNAELSEVWVVVNYFSSVVSASGVSSGERFIEVWVDGTDLGIDIDGTTENTTALGGGSVPDNANDWVFFEGMPYADNISISVNSTQQLLYQPNTIISGTTLPDRAGSNDGVITWGANPSGVAVTLGSFTSSGQTTTSTAVTDTPNDVLPSAVGQADYNVAPDVTGTLLTHPMRPFVTILSDTTTLNETQAWRYFGIVFVLLVLAATAKVTRGHPLITGVGAGAAVVVMVVQTIFPLGALVVTVIAVLLGLVVKRSPVL